MLIETNYKKEPFLIFSFFRDGRSPLSPTEETELLERAGLKYKEVVGVYKGELERSYLVIDQGDAFVRVLDLAAKADQDTILVVDENRESQLYFIKSSKTEYLGEFKCVPETEARQVDSYTFDSERGAYYVTEGG